MITSRSVGAGAGWARARDCTGPLIVTLVRLGIPAGLAVLMWCLPERVFAGVDMWTTTGPLPARVTSLAIDPATPSIVYSGVFTGTTTSGGVFRSADGGASWPVRVLTDQFITALETGPAGTVYAGSDSYAVFKSTDSGLNWSRIVTAPSGNGVDFIKADPTAPATLYRATSQRVTVGGDIGGELLRSTDGGASWTMIRNGLGFLAVRALALDPQNSGTLYAVTGTGFFKSTDFGSSWSAIANGLTGQTVSVLAVDPFNPRTIYAGTVNGVSKSTDGGATFTSSSLGLPNVRVADLAADPVHPSRLYVGTLGAGVFASSNGGATWTALNHGLANLNVTKLVIDRTGTFLHAGTQGGGVFDLQIDPSGGGSCSAGPTALCLNSNRFRVEVNWRVPSQGTSGVGQAVPMSSDTGSFWFFNSGNVELVVKVLDGRVVNGRFWVFYGALSNVEYTITVTDTMTGAVKTYFNPSGQLASFADTSAF